MRTRVEDLFHEAADLSGEERARYLEARNAGRVTRIELDELLAFDSDTCALLEGNIAELAGEAIDRLHRPDMLCGPYLLKSLLGRGGMGSVYLAERVDGEVTQQVAVKLLHAGMSDPRLLRHFLTERQILAGLSHPNVARLLDVGHREDGQPYLVMEYVEGKSLDTYTARLSLRARVRLFLKVCGAVSYLHRNLVVHRDLKPANILVTAEGEPKLLDFGIARILDQASDSAATSLRILTPQFASPEQLAGQPVSTLTDVYSLGAVLYRVLAGDRKTFDASTGEDTAPSGFPPLANAAPECKGDLEFIVMKALRQEPRERYSTVEQFAEDLENYLERRCIRARKDDAWYRARRLLRRYWVFAGVAAAIVCSLATGLILAERERAVAERRFGQLRQLSSRVIDLDRAIRTLPGSMEARQGLVAASLEYLEGLSREAGANAALAQEVADGYWRMARIQGVNAEFNMGEPAKAEESLRKADALIEGVLAAAPADRNAVFRSAMIAHDRMIAADTEGKRADALTNARKAADRLDEFMRLGKSDIPVHVDGFMRPGVSPDNERSAVALLYSNVALGFVNMHRYEDGARYARRAVEIVEKMPHAGEAHGSSLSVLANALRYQGDLDGAHRTIRRAREVTADAVYPSETARFFNRYALLQREGLILGEEGAVNLERPGEAIALLTESVSLAEDAAGRNAHDSASRARIGSTTGALGDILRERDPRRAIEVFDLGIRRLREAGSGTGTKRALAGLLARSSWPLRGLGRSGEAGTRVAEALSILRETGDYPSAGTKLGSEVWYAQSALAAQEAAEGDPARGLETEKQLLASVMSTKPDMYEDLRDVPKLARTYADLASLSMRAGDRTGAASMRSREIELWSYWQRRLPQNAYLRHRLEQVKPVRK